jgi:phosphoribosyl-ATP pyrophosphohydrolase
MTRTEILAALWDVIEDRAAHPSDASYVSRILRDSKGVDRALEKMGEESIEFLLAVKNGGQDRTVAEAADLLFHYLIALRAAGLTLEDVLVELEKRRK